MTRRTPQEKKALSYAKDRRNIYRANDKASRRLIPIRKAEANRGIRRKVDGILRGVTSAADTEQVELIADNALSASCDGWKKAPDEALGTFVERKLEFRSSHAGNGKTARKSVREFLRKLKVRLDQESDGQWAASAAVENIAVLAHRDTRESAVARCKDIAGAYYLEAIGAGEVISAGENSISIRVY
jgi:hypothetical protein